MLYNDRLYRDRRRQLRKNQTQAECFLWQHLRKGRFLRLKFFRQYGVGHYILDFYCPRHRLAIELDGSQHAEPMAMKYDDERTAYLHTVRITVLRFWNNDITERLEAVLETIRSAVEDSGGESGPNPSALRAPPL